MAEEFAAAPKVVKPKPKYKQQPQQQEDDEIKLIYNNLMWDKRIFRGNTYSAIVISKKNENGYEGKPKKALLTQKISQETANNFDGSNKRASIEIYTDEFVESLTDKPPKYQYASQTDALSDKTIVRHRMPAKSGKDTETQIWDDQLFDFDYEAEPLLNVLCGRTLEISRMEVLQEEELRIMSNRQQELKLYQKEQNKKIQNMYEDQDKLEQENIKILQDFKKQKQQKIKTHKKIFSRVLAKQYVRDIKQNTLHYIQGNGFFRNVVDIRLISQLLPKIYQNTSVQAHQESKYYIEAEKILKEAKDGLVKQHQHAKQIQRQRRQKIIDKRDEMAREKGERKAMEVEEKLMRKFLVDEKIYLEQQQVRRLAEAAKQEGGEVKEQ